MTDIEQMLRNLSTEPPSELARATLIETGAAEPAAFDSMKAMCEQDAWTVCV